MDLRDLDDLGRYEWVHELVDDSPVVRARALARQNHLLDQTRRHGRSGNLTGTLVDPVRRFTSLVPPYWSSAPRAPDREEYARLSPFGLLFLRWEERFPEEWHSADWVCSLWGEKAMVLHAFRAGEPTPVTRSALEDLLIAAVRRTQRCEDRSYWSLARRIDTPELRGRLTEVAAESEKARLRAGFVLWLMEHPGESPGSASWLRWRRSHGCPITVPAPAAELEQMRAANAASLLADLPAAELARVLEGLQSGPAARIAAHLPANGPAAVELMDLLISVRMLKAMDPHAAARLLEAAMNPAAAAARITGPKRAQLLTLMDVEAAIAVLRAMPVATAGERLEWVRPFEAAAALVQAMDPEFAVSVLAAMPRSGPESVLMAMSPDTAAPLLVRLRQDPAFPRALPGPGGGKLSGDGWPPGPRR